MISIARKNLHRLSSNPNSYLCNSNVHFFLSINPFSTSRGKRLIPNPKILNLLVDKHNFSPDSASLASLHFPQFIDPKRVDSVLSLLKENIFTTVQLEKIVECYPRILGFSIESIKFRLKVFRDLGLSSEEIANIISRNKSILEVSMENRVIPSLSVLKGLLGSNDDVVRLLRKSVWFLVSDLEKTLLPNVEILKRSGISLERILRFLYFQPRCFLIKPDIMMKSVDKVIEFGVSMASAVFIHAVMVLAFTSEGMWEVKLQTFHELGFSDDDISAMFRKQPLVLSTSGKKITDVVELLLGTGKYNISNIVSNPSSLGCSIQKRLEPRLQILGVLESRNLIETWPGFARICQWKDDEFYDKVIRPYHDEIGKEHITRYVSSVKRR